MYGFLLTINIYFYSPDLFDTPYDSHGVFDASLITTPTTRELYSLPEDLFLKVIQIYDALMTVFLLLIYSQLYQCKLLAYRGFYHRYKREQFCTNSNKSSFSYTYYGKSKIGILLSTISYLVKNFNCKLLEFRYLDKKISKHIHDLSDHLSINVF